METCIVALQNHSRTAKPWFLTRGHANEKHSDRWHGQMEWIPEGECSREKRNSEHGKNMRTAAAITVSTKVEQVEQIASKIACGQIQREELRRQLCMEVGCHADGWCWTLLLQLLARDQRQSLPKLTAGRSAEEDAGTQREVQLSLAGNGECQTEQRHKAQTTERHELRQFWFQMSQLKIQINY